MAQHPPDTQTPVGSASENERRGSSGPGLAPALVAMIGIILAIFGLLALGGAVALGIAIVLMIGGLAGLVLYVYRMSRTRVSRAQLPRGLAGWDYDPAISDDPHADISPDDLPLGSPGRREIERRIHDAERKLPQSEWPAAQRYRP